MAAEGRGLHGSHSGEWEYCGCQGKWVVGEQPKTSMACGKEGVELTKWELRGKRGCLEATTLEMQRKERKFSENRTVGGGYRSIFLFDLHPDTLCKPCLGSLVWGNSCTFHMLGCPPISV